MYMIPVRSPPPSLPVIQGLLEISRAFPVVVGEEIFEKYTNNIPKVRPVRGPGLGPGRAGPALVLVFSIYLVYILDMLGYSLIKKQKK